MKSFDLFDKYVLLRIKFLDTPTPQPSQQSQSSQRPSQPSSTHFGDAYYNILTTEVLEIKTQQASKLESQTLILNNQVFILVLFMNMQLRMDHIEETQHEIIQILSNQFSQLSPSGSNA